MTIQKPYSVRMLFVFMCSLTVLLASFETNTAKADISALVAEVNGNLDKLDITTGTYSTISNSGTAYEGLAYNSNESVLYGIVSNSFPGPSSLVTIDPATGTNSPIGANGVSLRTVTNLADGRLFGVDTNESLYQINTITGAATLVGATGLAAGSVSDSLASNGTTLFYTYAAGSGESSLYTLSLATGASTLVGTTGADGIIGSAFAGPTFATGQLYGFTNGGETDSIDLTTGAATKVNSNGISDIFGGVGIVTAATLPPVPPSSVPLPAALWPSLATLGLLILVARVRSKMGHA